MNRSVKILLIASMTAALFFGFLHIFIPGIKFERLHIFLFNLCTGGTALLIFTEGKEGYSLKTGAFFILAIAYAIVSFFNIYLPAIIIAVVLHLLAESVRRKRFAFIPLDFFKSGTAVAEKFHHASVLSLSLGLLISAFVVWNHEFGGIITAKKFTLDIFFLGFSFPVSLITMSVMFGMMRPHPGKPIMGLMNFSFWGVNLGVIIFFILILMEAHIAEVIMSSVLFITVLIIFFLYIRLGIKEQPRSFLTSGIVFLITTAITGILYIALNYYPITPDPPGGSLILRIHALVSLYGWNLNGLIVIVRYNDFPIRLHSGRIILLHWIIVTILAPLAYFMKGFVIIAILAYAFFLGVTFFSRGKMVYVKSA